MRVVFWNRKWNGGAGPQSGYLGRLRWDVLALAEVTRSAKTRFEAVLGPAAGFTLDEVDVRDRRYPHGLALFVRPNIVVDSFKPFVCNDSELSCRAERGFDAQLTTERSSIQLLAWQAPYAAGRSTAEKLRNPLVKQHGYVHLARRLAECRYPIVLALDGNNWGDWLQPRHVVDKHDPWDDERRFHGPDPAHGLVDTLRAVVQRGPTHAAAADPGEPLAVTKVTPRAGRHRMDRIYVSSDVEIVDAGVDYDGRRAADVTDLRTLTCGSDHAAVWAEIGGA